jgi:hypothetical protein
VLIVTTNPTLHVLFTYACEQISKVEREKKSFLLSDKTHHITNYMIIFNKTTFTTH